MTASPQRTPAIPLQIAPFALTRARVQLCAVTLIVLNALVIAGQFIAARDLVLPGGAVVGGDYAAFYAAGKAAAGGRAADIYDPVAFEALLHDVAPQRDRYGLTWQYPPTYFFAVTPFASLGYVPGYLAWIGLTALGWIFSLRAAGCRGILLLVALAAPAAFHTIITGQNGFLTAALILVAALRPDRRPLLAGCAAALLTMKPQLGLLIPIAYAAGGCWRAFSVAALGACALAAMSALTFGVETWAAFLDGAGHASRNLAAGILPLYKMTTPYAAAQLAGLGENASAVVLVILAVAAAGAVALVWRRTQDAELRAIALISCAFLAAPYGYYYELILLAAPLALIARRSEATGWLRHERLLISLVFLLPMLMPGNPMRAGFSLGFFIVLLAAFASLRRIGAEAPHIFRFSSAAFRRRPD